MTNLVYQVVDHGSSEYAATVRLRRDVLRTPLGLDFEPGEFEAESDCVHLACFEGARLIGCVVLSPLGQGTVRLRQLVVAPDRQGCGIGSRLMRQAEAAAWARGFDEIVLHARAEAVGFYRPLGYRAEGEAYIELGIPHVGMRKGRPETSS